MEYYIYSKSLVKGYEAVRGLFGGGGGALRASSLWARVELSSSSPPIMTSCVKERGGVAPPTISLCTSATHVHMVWLNLCGMNP